MITKNPSLIPFFVFRILFYLYFLQFYFFKIYMFWAWILCNIVHRSLVDVCFFFQVDNAPSYIGVLKFLYETVYLFCLVMGYALIHMFLLFFFSFYAFHSFQVKYYILYFKIYKIYVLQYKISLLFKCYL